MTNASNKAIKKMTIQEIAELLKGEVIGDHQIIIERLSGIDHASEGALTFLANMKYLKKVETTRASAILVPSGTKIPGKNLILVAEPYAAFAKLMSIYYPEEPATPGIMKGAFIEEGADVSKDATVYPGVFIGRKALIEKGCVLHPGVYIGRNSVIGEGSILYPNVCVYNDCLIGKRVILHAGVVIGSDGFGFIGPGKENIKIPQVGIVQIDDDVEIGANTTIDRGTIDKTWIKRGVKIDNIVQIGHNVEIGENSIIVAQVGISGSTKIGNGVIIGGQAGLVGHIQIGDNVMVGAQSGVHDDVPSGQIVSGSPHMPHRKWLRVEACVSSLPEMRNKVTSLLRRVEELESLIKKECK